MNLLTRDECSLIGMVHLLPLPGSPGYSGEIDPVLELAEQDAQALIDGGCDGIIVENMGDVPYLKGKVPPETVAAMALATERVAKMGKPTGVQVLAGANREALGVALAAGAQFIRVEGFAFAHVADEGWMDACAGELMRTKKNLRCDVEIWADVQKKHAAHMVTGDLTLEDLAKGTVFFGADAIIVTGKATGEETSVNDVKRAKIANRPVLVGSGVTPDNAALLAAHANALIVGSWNKTGGTWRNRVDAQRVKELKESMR